MRLAFLYALHDSSNVIVGRSDTLGIRRVVYQLCVRQRARDVTADEILRALLSPPSSMTSKKPSQSISLICIDICINTP